MVLNGNNEAKTIRRRKCNLAFMLSEANHISNGLLDNRFIPGFRYVVSAPIIFCRCRKKRCNYRRAEFFQIVASASFGFF